MIKISNKTSDLPLTSMASRKHPATMENLPEEILLKIFIRLLAKQLAQMRSISKSWNALLSQPSFIESHLNRSIHNKDQILMVFYHERCPSYSKPLTAHPSQSPHLELTEFNNLPPVNPKSGDTAGIRVIGSVNGLICSSYDDDSVIHIWNPSLSAVSTLPPNSIPSCGISQINLRFGFDPKTDDYKVVKITGIPIMQPISANNMIHLITDTIKEWLQVEVYSMRKGYWELITARLPSHIKTIYNTDHVCVDGHHGHLHWLACIGDEKPYSKTIVAFDLGSQTFSEIPLPDSSTLDHYNRIDFIGVLAGNLCVVSRVGDGTCEVWVMEEYGVNESWVKRHVFSQFTKQTCPFGITSHNEFLIDDSLGNGRFVLYNPVANKTKFLKKVCCRKLCCPQNIVEHVDSLVWVAPAEREMVDGVGQH